MGIHIIVVSFLVANLKPHMLLFRCEDNKILFIEILVSRMYLKSVAKKDLQLENPEIIKDKCNESKGSQGKRVGLNG